MINRRVQNGSKFYKIIQLIVWNRQILKQGKRTFDKIYFKLILVFNAGRWTVTKINKSEIPAMDMIFLGSTGQNTRKNRIIIFFLEMKLDSTFFNLY